MDVVGFLKVNDGDTGELVERVRRIFTCDECEDFDEFCKHHENDIQEFLENLLQYDYDESGAISRFELFSLADDFDEDDDDSDDEDDDEPTPPDLPEWHDNIIIRRMREGVTR